MLAAGHGVLAQGSHNPGCACLPPRSPHPQMGRAQLLKEGNKKYGCPSGADFVDGDPLFRPDPVAAQALGQTKHNSGEDAERPCVQRWLALPAVNLLRAGACCACSAA